MDQSDEKGLDSNLPLSGFSNSSNYDDIAKNNSIDKKKQLLNKAL